MYLGFKNQPSTFSPLSTWLTCESRASKWRKKTVVLSSSLNWWVKFKKIKLLFSGLCGGVEVSRQAVVVTHRVVMMALFRWLSHYYPSFKYLMTLVEVPHILYHCSIFQVQKEPRKTHGSFFLFFPFSFFFLFLLFSLLLLFLSRQLWLPLPKPRPKPTEVPRWMRRTQDSRWHRPWWCRRRQRATPIVTTRTQTKDLGI